jgi:hypothetical protein
MDKFEKYFRPSSMVDEKEWEGFRADIIACGVCGIIVLVAVILLTQFKSVDSPAARSFGPSSCDESAQCG